MKDAYVINPVTSAGDLLQCFAIKGAITKAFFPILIIFPHLSGNLLHLCLQFSCRHTDRTVSHDDHLLQAI